MLQSTSHLFSTVNYKFHLKSSASFSRWWYLHTFCFGGSWEKSKQDWHFWLNFSITWTNTVCVPKWWWVLAPRPYWARKHELGGCGLSPMWGVLEKRVTTGLCHAPLIPLLSPGTALDETQRVNPGVSEWEDLSLGCTSLDLGAFFCHWSFCWQNRCNEDL